MATYRTTGDTKNMVENNVEFLQQILFCTQISNYYDTHCTKYSNILNTFVIIITLLLHICDITSPYHIFLF